MLLVLYENSDNFAHTVTNLISYTTAPLATGIRYISILLEEGFVQRADDRRDGRVHWISLTQKGRKAIEEYLTATLRSSRDISCAA